MSNAVLNHDQLDHRIRFRRHREPLPDFFNSLLRHDHQAETAEVYIPAAERSALRVTFTGSANIGGTSVSHPQDHRKSAAKRGVGGPGRTRSCNQTVMSGVPYRGRIEFSCFFVLDHPALCRFVHVHSLANHWPGFCAVFSLVMQSAGGSTNCRRHGGQTPYCAAPRFGILRLRLFRRRPCRASLVATPCISKPRDSFPSDTRGLSLVKRCLVLVHCKRTLCPGPASLGPRRS